MSDQLREKIQASLGTTYTLGRELGGGGMARVFLGEDTTLGRSVVVKVLNPELREDISAERFAREIRLTARLQEPHIVPVLSAGATADGVPYFTMPYVTGESLRARLAEGPLPKSAAIGILRDVARALAYAHRQGIVHRDIKAENVLLSEGTAVVTDFGIAKAVAAARTHATAASGAGGSARGTLTEVGASVGTPAYMAPEQIAGDAVDHRADLYAWGILAYELLAGVHPFAEKRTAQQLLAAHLAEQPQDLASRARAVGAPAVSPALAALVAKCLAKNPDGRPQSAQEILDRLDAADSTGGSRSDSDARVPRRHARRLAVAAAAAVVIAVLAVPAARSWRAAGHGRAPRSVGVIPFATLGAAQDSGYFSEGITEEIVGALGKVPELRVATEQSSPTARALADPQGVGRALGVDAVLLGSIQRVGQRVRITARLVDVARGIQLWSEQYDRDLRDVFALQDELAKAIVGELRPQLTNGSAQTLVRAGTADPEAHLLYLQGMYFWNRRRPATLWKAIELFKQAAARDSGYAAPYAGLALSYAVIVDYVDLDVRVMADSAIRAARMALARDSSSADAYTGLAMAYANLWDHRRALDAFAHALAVDPNDARAHHWYAEILAHVGRTDEALREIHRAQEIEPLTIIINANVGRIELEARHYALAEATLRHTIELDSSQITSHHLLSMTLAEERRLPEAIAQQEIELRLSGKRGSWDLAQLGWLYALAGRRAEAESLLHEIERRAPRERISYGGLALLRSALGERDAAVATLDTGVSRYDPELQMGSREPIFDQLRADPRTTALFARVEGTK